MNHRQQLFANTYLRHNDPLVAYIEAYKPKDASNYLSIKSAANRLLRKAEIAEYISSVRDSVRSQLEYELKEKMKEEALTVHEKRLYIKRVINGEILIPQDYKANGCNRCTMFIRPTFPQILGYLKEDSRLAGHYPDKRKTSTRQNSSLEGGVPTAGRNGGCTPAPGTREQQQPNTERSLSQLKKTSNQQQMTTNSLPHNTPPSKAGGNLVQDIRQEESQQKTTNDASPLTGVQAAIGIGVKPIPATPPHVASHAGLRKLIEKQRQRNNRETVPV